MFSFPTSRFLARQLLVFTQERKQSILERFFYDLKYEHLQFKLTFKLLTLNSYPTFPKNCQSFKKPTRIQTKVYNLFSRRRIKTKKSAFDLD